MSASRRRIAIGCLLAGLLRFAAPDAHADWAHDADQLKRAGRWQEAISTLEPVARSGDAQAQAMLGNTLLARANPLRDEASGMAWLRRAARQGNVNALSTIGYPLPYVAQAQLSCGEARLTVMTSCRAFGPDQGPFCFAQTFLFESPGERSPRRVLTETHADFADAPLLAVRVSCLEERKGFAVEYSNLGSGRSCKGCEGRRDFDERGRRLQSTSARRSEAMQVQVPRFPSPAALEPWFRE